MSKIKSEEQMYDFHTFKRVLEICYDHVRAALSAVAKRGSSSVIFVTQNSE